MTACVNNNNRNTTVYVMVTFSCLLVKAFWNLGLWIICSRLWFQNDVRVDFYFVNLTIFNMCDQFNVTIIRTKIK